MPKKIAFIGAGSFTFTRNLVRDILSYPAFDDATIALMDIDPERLDFIRRACERIAADGRHPAKIVATLDRREALEGADGVVTTILQGGPDVWKHDLYIPKKYGVDTNIGDTRGPSGIFRFLRTVNPILEIAADIERICPSTVFLNYTNPMAMLCRAVQGAHPGITASGLCHSVQGTAAMLAKWIGARPEEISYTCAGINHQAFYLDFLWNGEDAYPLIRKAVLERPEIYNEEIVRNEMFLALGYYPTESSGHNSEYNPWFRKRQDLIEKYCLPGTGWNPGEYAYIVKSYANREKTWDEDVAKWFREPIDLKRGQEYAAYIFNAVFGDGEMFRFNGNVRNFGLVDNPPSEDFGQREFVHAGAMARLYILALKYYPKVMYVNTWMWPDRAFLDHDLQPFAWLKMVNTLGHLFPDPRYYGGARPYPDVRGHVFLQDDKAILAVWTSNNDVERGTRKGPVLKMRLPKDATFIDLMGNERRGDGAAVPLTPAPLFIVSAKENAAALVEAVKTAATDDPSQAIVADIHPMPDGSVEMEVANATSVPQTANLGGGRTLALAAGETRTERLAPPQPPRPMEMRSFATNYPFLAKPWKVSYFFIPKCGAKPDWSKVPSLPIANEVRRSPAKPVTMKSSFQAAWNEERLFLRVEVEDDAPLRREAFGNVRRDMLYLIDECLEVYFDAFADGRKATIDGFDENDSRYDFAAGSVWRLLAVNWQLAQGTASATDEEVAEKLEHRWTPTEKGCIYEIAFAPRYLAPIELKPGTRASLGLYIHDRDTPEDKGENGLSNATEHGKVCNKLPRYWPEFILLP